LGSVIGVGMSRKVRMCQDELEYPPQLVTNFLDLYI
jgi:hypothetical protein